MEYQQKVKKTANVSYAREATSFHIWRAFVDYSLVCVCLLRATLWNSSQMKNDAQIMKIINWVHIFPSKWRVASMRTKKTIMQQPTSSELNVQLIDFVHFIYLFFVPCEVWIELPRIVVERVPISNAFIIWVIMRTKWQHKSTGTDFGFWVFFLSVCAKKFACRQPIMACEHLLIATKPKCRPIVVNEQDLFFMCSLIAILANTFERHKMMGRAS